MSKLIYIADDEDNIRNLVKTFSKNEGHDVMDFKTGDELLEQFNIKECDLVILDIMMPGSSGFEVCTKLREKSTVPIIMLTARDTDIDYITGITLGSDDYFTKPFSPMSLVMRVKSIFRRIEFEKKQNYDKYSNSIDMELKFGDVIINKKNKIVTSKNVNIDLTPNEYNLLTYLFENIDRAISRDELLNKIWGYDIEVETRAADDTVKRLRKKILDTNILIETVWGFGFRLKEKS
ncbi:response regulator transcription factor [Clostridioides difficile]|nr:response regulator transcription factor [Clostridioides difficile]